MKLNFIFIIFLFISIFKVSSAEQVDFNVWIEDFKVKAEASGISKETVNQVLDKSTVIPRIIELDRNQPEFKLTLTQYLNNVVSKRRITKGVKKIRENWDLLEELSKKYKVQKRFIVALWGIETDYGRVTGGFSVTDALVTLAYDGRRGAYFSKELINALKIIDQGHIMPSSFLSYAQDYNND